MQWCSLILFACQWHVSERNGGADICRETVWSSLSGAHPEKGEHSELGSHCWRKRQCGAPGASEEGAIKPFVTNGVNPTYLKNCFLLPGPYKHLFSWYQLINIRNTKSLFVCMIFSHTHTHTHLKAYKANFSFTARWVPDLSPLGPPFPWSSASTWTERSDKCTWADSSQLLSLGSRSTALMFLCYLSAGLYI